jgi:hypothetical protein
LFLLFSGAGVWCGVGVGGGVGGGGEAGVIVLSLSLMVRRG